MTSDFDNDDKYKTVTKTRQVVDSYKITTEQPFGHFVLELEPKLKALAPVQCVIAPLVSRTDIVIFWRFIGYDYSDWDSLVAKSWSKWARAETKLRDKEGLAEIVSEVWKGLVEFTLTPILERWPTTSETNSEATPNESSETAPQAELE